MPLLREHLLRLDPASRHDRFNGSADERFIEAYAARCLADGTVVIAYVEDDKVLAAAEPDFKANVFHRRIEQCCERLRPGRCDLKRKTGQQMLDQIGLMDAQLVPFAAAEERAMAMRIAVFTRQSGLAGRPVGLHRSV